jgi:hypothetical protein
VSFYIKHITKQHIGKEKLQEIIRYINAAPSLPENFKATYKSLHPNIFKRNFNANFIYHAFGRCGEQSASRQVANHYSWLYSDKSNFKRHLYYVGLIWLIEHETKQEKCFEYIVSKHDFLNNKIGFSEASLYYYKTSPEHLNPDQQLEMILRIQNPAIYNCERYPERCHVAVEELKSRMKPQTKK